jgi:hypothetical protein
MIVSQALFCCGGGGKPKVRRTGNLRPFQYPQKPPLKPEPEPKPEQSKDDDKQQKPEDKKP